VINRVDFSANAPVYDIRHGALLPDHVAGALTTRLKPGARILDVGAGTGRVSVAFARIGFDVVAIEPAPGMLQALREKAGALSIPCIAAEGSRLPFQNRIADAVVSLACCTLSQAGRACCAQSQMSLQTTDPFSTSGERYG